MTLKICLAGATGWAGSELARGIAVAADLNLVAAVARRHAGQKLGDVLRESRLDAPIFGGAAEALAQPCDVFVEYTKPDSAKANILAALEHGAHVVVGTSGLTDEDYAQIDAVARERRRGVLACGNFALTAVLLIKFAEMAAKLIPQWEIIDYASAGKPDAPSGTVRELAGRLGKVRQPKLEVPLEQTIGLRETLLPTDWVGWAACLGLGVMHVAGQGSIAWALGRLPAATASVVVLIQPVVAALLGWVLFNELFGPWQAFGGAVALGGVVLAQWASRAKPASADAPA